MNTPKYFPAHKMKHTPFYVFFFSLTDFVTHDRDEKEDVFLVE